VVKGKNHLPFNHGQWIVNRVEEWLIERSISV